MIELNPSTQPASSTGPDTGHTRDTPGPGLDWPASPLDAARQDPAVSALLDRLGALPDLPVASHGEVYAVLHEGLMAALNEDLAAQPDAGGPAA